MTAEHWFALMLTLYCVLSVTVPWAVRKWKGRP